MKKIDHKILAFTFTAAGKPAREQEVKKSGVWLREAPDEAAHLTFWIRTTRPGETSDDRGVEGWDMPVEVTFTTEAVALDQDGEIAIQDQAERFIYYWDHSGLTDTRLTVRREAAGLGLSFVGTSEAGDRVDFAVVLFA